MYVKILILLCRDDTKYSPTRLRDGTLLKSIYVPQFPEVGRKANTSVQLKTIIKTITSLNASVERG